MSIWEWIKGLWSIGMAYAVGLLLVRIFKIEHNQYQSGHLEGKWAGYVLRYREIKGVVDLDGGIDHSTVRKHLDWYKPYFITDGDLPDLQELWAVAEEAYAKIGSMRVLSHCGGGVNRASLMNGCILYFRGYRGPDIVKHIRAHRPGALTNGIFRRYLEGLVNDEAKFVRVK